MTLILSQSIGVLADKLTLSINIISLVSIILLFYYISEELLCTSFLVFFLHVVYAVMISKYI